MDKLISLIVAGVMIALPAVMQAEPAIPRPAWIRQVSGDILVQAAAPGQAQCFATAAAENKAAAQVTSARRAGAGLRPLRPNPKLAEAAARHACDMAMRGQMAHRGSASKGPSQRVKGVGYKPAITAENIAAGPFSLEQVLHAWNGSDGHLRNIMLPQATDFGIGRAVAADGRTMFWAAIYAAPRGR